MVLQLAQKTLRMRRGAYGVRDEVVNKPGDGNTEPLLPIAAENKPVRGRATNNGVLLVVRGLLHLEPPDEHEGGRDESETERYPPGSTKMVVTAAMVAKLVSAKYRSRTARAHIHTRTNGTNEEMTQPKSIIESGKGAYIHQFFFPVGKRG